jgi:DnaJ-class molecular chaperone
MNDLVKCPKCNGDGEYMLPDLETLVVCTNCGGTGKVKEDSIVPLDVTMKDIKEAVARKNLMDAIETKCYKLSTEDMVRVDKFIDSLH